MCRSHAWPCPVLGCAQSDFLNVNPLCPLASGRASRPHGREDLICESQDQPGLVTVSLFRCHAVYPCPGQAENRRGAGQTQQFQYFKNIKELRVSIDWSLARRPPLRMAPLPSVPDAGLRAPSYFFPCASLRRCSALVDQGGDSKEFLSQHMWKRRWAI